MELKLSQSLAGHNLSTEVDPGTCRLTTVIWLSPFQYSELPFYVATGRKAHNKRSPVGCYRVGVLSNLLPRLGADKTGAENNDMHNASATKAPRLN